MEAEEVTNGGTANMSDRSLGRYAADPDSTPPGMQVTLLEGTACASTFILIPYSTLEAP